MLLRELDSLYDRLLGEDRLPPVGYVKKPVRFLVELTAAGQCTAIISTGVGKEATQRRVPDVSRTGIKAPAFLVCDNAQYVLGLAQTGGDAAQQKADRARERYLEVLTAAIGDLDGIDPPAVRELRAVQTFVADASAARQEFTQWGFALEPNPKGVIAEASERIGFLVDGADPVALDSVRQWWAERNNQHLVSEVDGICQVSGNTTALARIMPGVSVKKGISQALISANFPSALRYNATQSRGAQISVPAAIRSHQALNWLLGDGHHHRLMGQITYVWWLEGDLTFDPFDIIAKPDPGDVEAMMARPWTGRPGLKPSTNFRILGLSLTEGRIVLRFDHTTTLNIIEANTRQWLDLIAQSRSDGSTWWPSINTLAEAALTPGKGTARQAQRDRVIQALARSAITATPLPRSHLAAVVDRCRSVPIPRSPAKKVDWSALGGRLAALHLHRQFKENTMATEPTAGDLCGRILAQLDNAQRQAVGETNRSVADRFYAGASTRPQSVFPGLLRTAKAHLSKIGRMSGGRGTQIAIERRLGELSGLLIESGGFPQTLNLDDQADFALAYWHERTLKGVKKATDPDSTQDDSTQKDTL